MTGKNIRGFLLFAFLIISLAAVLRLLNWLPSSMEEGLAHRYSSIEDVKAKLKLRQILVPSYFPQQYVWPPYDIVAQTKPFTSVVMKFRSIDGKPDSLVITQSASKTPISYSFPAMSPIKESTRFDMKGRQAVLDVGDCGHGETCTRITWHEGRYSIAVAAYSPPFDVIRISESMIQ